MTQFTKKVDMELLNKTFYFHIQKQYLLKIRDHQKYVPKELSEYLEILKDKESYKRLLNCLSEWMTTMELCDDLFARIKLYGIAEILDEKHLESKLRQNWAIHKDDDKSTMTKALETTQGAFSSFVFGLSHRISSWLNYFGVASALEHSVFRFMFGVYLTHPAVFAGSIVSAILLKLGTDKLEMNQMLNELDKITDHFIVITSNLDAQYKNAS